MKELASFPLPRGGVVVVTREDGVYVARATNGFDFVQMWSPAIGNHSRLSAADFERYRDSMERRRA